MIKLDKIKVQIAPLVAALKRPFSLEEAAVAADWSDDPGTGKAILLPDGREVLNPLPIAPPVGYKSEPSIMEMIDRQLRVRLAGLQNDDVIDTLEEVDDFNIDDDPEPISGYEFVELEPEAPAIPAGGDPNGPGEQIASPVPPVKPEKAMKPVKKPPPDDGGEAEV